MTNQEVIALCLTVVNVFYGIAVTCFLEIWDECDTVKRAIVGLTAMVPFFGLSYYLLKFCEVI